ncbi:MAG: hypothetical protein GTO18_20200 [Anaerolineales bacterium]|nr:hypothetical protein [Anaerolineales bacterium]
MDKNELDHERILQNHTDCLNLLKGSIDGLKESDLDVSIEQDEWTIREIIHHITDGDYIWKICIQHALGESERPFHVKWYWEKEQVEWSHSWKYSAREIEPSLSLLEANRNHVHELLRKIPRSLSKTVIIEWPDGDQQEVNIGWVLEMQTNHVERHVEEIQRIRETNNL